MQKQPPIAAFHHLGAEFDQADGAAAQVVGLPAGFGHLLCAEQHGRDLAIAGAGAPPLERAQAQDQPLPACSRQRWGISPGRATDERAPQRNCRGRADVQELVERNDHCPGISAGRRCNDPVDAPAEFEGQLQPTALQRSKLLWGEPEARIDELSRKCRQADDAGQRLLDPANRVGGIRRQLRREIVTPSEG